MSEWMSLLLLGLSSFRLTSLAAAGKPRDAVKFYEIALMHLTADLALTNSNRLELGCLYHELIAVLACGCSDVALFRKDHRERAALTQFAFDFNGA